MLLLLMHTKQYLQASCARLEPRRPRSGSRRWRRDRAAPERCPVERSTRLYHSSRYWSRSARCPGPPGMSAEHIQTQCQH